MTRRELQDKLAQQAGLPSKAAAGEALDAIVDSVTESLASGETVTLTGFGTFSVAQRAERTGRNPRTGAPLNIPASKAVKFSPGRFLKDAVN